MKVYLLNENRVNIYLNLQEIKDIFGGYENIDYDIPDCRVKIHGLIAATLPQTLQPLDCQKVLIEVKPKLDGCTISLTKVYRDRLNNNYENTTVLIFKNSETLIYSLPELNKLKYSNSELYVSYQRYALILTTQNDISIHISEYCEIVKNEYTAEKIREYWQKVSGTDAVKLLSNAFLK